MSVYKIVRDKRPSQGKGKEKSFESDELTYYECLILILKEVLIFRLKLRRDIYLETDNSYVHFVSYNLNSKSF